MTHEVLTPARMAQADRRTIESGLFDGAALMERAGAAVVDEILRRHPDRTSVDVLCGPGNNGGDGYVVARLLAGHGHVVRVFAERPPNAGTDAERARAACPVPVAPLGEYEPAAGSVLVDALYGAGFRGELGGAAEAALLKSVGCDLARVAVDLPSGVNGHTGAGEVVFRADVTVTFVRPKPGHLLHPGKRWCGELVVADIGVPDRAVAGDPLRPHPIVANHPDQWRDALMAHDATVHKYARGHCAVFSGGPTSTGAARLAALAAARAGAGAVTVLSPPDALAANAAHLTAIMLAERGTPDRVADFARSRKVRSAVIGPGFGGGDEARRHVLGLIDTIDREDADGPLLGGIVLDADALTAFEEDPAPLFAAARSKQGEGPSLVLTPHEGEFRRLFPDIAADASLSKVEKAGLAAERAGGVVAIKGDDTVIASGRDRAAINVNGSPWLATAGSGDVLAGMVGGLLARRVAPFEAACAAVWIHAEAARRFGPGLIAEDLPGMLPGVLSELVGRRV